MKKYLPLPVIMYVVWIALLPFFLNSKQDAQASKTTRSQIPVAVESVDRLDHKVKAPQENVYYNLGNRLTLAPGAYRISYSVMAYSSRLDDGTVEAFVSLGKSPTGEDAFFTRACRVGGKSFRSICSLDAERVVVVDTPTTYYLNVMQSSGGHWDTLQFLGARSPTIIRAEFLG